MIYTSIKKVRYVCALSHSLKKLSEEKKKKKKRKEKTVLLFTYFNTSF